MEKVFEISFTNEVQSDECTWFSMLNNIKLMLYNYSWEALSIQNFYIQKHFQLNTLYYPRDYIREKRKIYNIFPIKKKKRKEGTNDKIINPTKSLSFKNATWCAIIDNNNKAQRDDRYIYIDISLTSPQKATHQKEDQARQLITITFTYILYIIHQKSNNAGRYDIFVSINFIVILLYCSSFSMILHTRSAIDEPDREL